MWNEKRDQQTEITISENAHDNENMKAVLHDYNKLYTLTIRLVSLKSNSIT